MMRLRIAAPSCLPSTWTSFQGYTEVLQKRKSLLRWGGINMKRIQDGIVKSQRAGEEVVVEMQSYVCGLLVVCVMGAAAAMPSDASEGRNSLHDNLMDKVLADCMKKDSLSCFKYKLFSYVDKAINSRDSFSLAEAEYSCTLKLNPQDINYFHQPGVNVVKSESSDASPRAFEDKPSDDVESMFLNRFERFMQTHTFKFDVKGADVLRAFSNAANSLGLLPEGEVEESRGKKKKAVKILLPLLLALKLKIAALIPLAIGAVALIATKALIIGKIALAISLVIALKKLLGGGNQQKSVTYEIVNHPHHSSHDAWAGDYGSSGNGGGGGHGGGWGRSTNDAHNLAYKAYQPQH